MICRCLTAIPNVKLRPQPAEEVEWRVTPKCIGGIIRQRLGVRTVRIGGNYVIPALELPRIEQLCEKYSIDPGARQPDEGFTF